MNISRRSDSLAGKDYMRLDAFYVDACGDLQQCTCTCEITGNTKKQIAKWLLFARSELQKYIFNRAGEICNHSSVKEYFLSEYRIRNKHA